MVEIIRLAESSPRIAEDLSALASELHGEQRIASVDDVMRMVTDPYTVPVVARDGERIVGMATLYIVQKVGRRTGFLEDVIVLGDYRGQGVGEKLVSTIIDIARERQVGSVNLTSNPSRVAAHKLYEKLGFQRRETDVFKLGLQ